MHPYLIELICGSYINMMLDRFGLVWFNPLYCFFVIECHVALDRNPGPGYDTLLLRMIPGDLLSAFFP